MSARDLRDEANYDLSPMEIAVEELEALRRDVGEREPTLREVMAAGARFRAAVTEHLDGLG